jgi:hypothetical protein
MLALFLLFSLLAGGGASPVHAQVQTLPLGGQAATTSSVDLLDNPSAGSKVIMTLPINTKANVWGGPFNDGWYWLEYNGTRGYAHGKSLVVADANWQPVPSATPTLPPTATPTRTSTPLPTATPDFGYGKLWVGELTAKSAVRSGAGNETKAVKTWWSGRRVLVYEQANDSKGAAWYRVSDAPEVAQWVPASVVKKVFDVRYEGARFKGRWVNVNLSQQVVTAYQDGVPEKVTLTSTGTARTPTEQGVQRVTWRVTSKRMRGGTPGIDYYDLPNVPYAQFFNATGEALHGTYWHDNFGRPMSHGCVNLSTPMSKWFYEWGTVGTIVWVHN